MIVPIVAVSFADGRAMVHDAAVAGTPLDAALATFGPAAIADALPRLRLVAAALDAAAAAGVCHGALQPRDLLIADRETRLVGVGVAAALADAGVRVIAPPPYAPPERVAGAPPAAAADVFALAAIAYEWLCGERIESRSPPVIPALSGVDRDALAAAFARALSPDPSSRFASCGALVSALDASRTRAAARVRAHPPALPLLEDLPLAASSASAVDDVEIPSAPLDIMPGLSDAPTRAAGFRAPVLLAVLAGGAVVGVAAAWFLVGRVAPSRAAGPAGSAPAAVVSSTAEVELVDAPPLAPPRDDRPLMPPPAVAPRSADDPSAAPRVVDAVAVEPPAPEAVDALVAAVLVHSTPAGAEVTVDGIAHGRTPVAVRGLPLGTRRVVVARDGYRPVARQIALTAERPSRRIEVELTAARARPAAAPAVAATGRLLVDSRPAGARVLLDGRAVGVTPLTLPEVTPGRHDVRLERSGYRAVTTSVEIKRGEQARVAARLEGGQDRE